VLKEDGYFTFGDHNKGRIIGEENIGNQHKTQIKNILYVNGLKHNLLSISQLCDKGFKIEFNNNCCLICEAKIDEVIHIGKRIGNIYMLKIKHASFHEFSCLVSKIDDFWLWHHRVSHINMHHLNHLVKKDLVMGIPKLKFEKNKLWEACQKGKQDKNSFQSKNVVSTSKPLERLHMDLFEPSTTMSLGGNYYDLVIVDDYSRFTWTLFLRTKNKFCKLAKVIQNEKGLNVVSIRSDHGSEFQNEYF